MEETLTQLFAFIKEIDKEIDRSPDLSHRRDEKRK